MIKELWEESSKRGTRIVSIIIFPLMFISYIAYKLTSKFKNALNTYESVFERWEHEDNIS